MSKNNNNGVAVKRLGGNVFTVASAEGLLTVLVSYETPVAVMNAEGRVYRSATRFSRSTEKHISDFQHGHPSGGNWLQENIDRALEELIGDTRLRGKSIAGKLGRVRNTERIDYDLHTEPGDRNLVVPVTRYRRSDSRYACNGRASCECIGCTKARW
jgi:hypothetical protein